MSVFSIGQLNAEPIITLTDTTKFGCLAREACFSIQVNFTDTRCLRLIGTDYVLDFKDENDVSICKISMVITTSPHIVASHDENKFPIMASIKDRGKHCEVQPPNTPIQNITIEFNGGERRIFSPSRFSLLTP